MRVLIAMLGLALMSCNGPGLEFRGRDATQIRMDGFTFNIFIKDGRAEAVRVGFVGRRELGRVYLSAARAMEVVSGCKVIDKSMRGDPAQMWARLNCSGRLVRSLSCRRDATHSTSRQDLVAVCETPSGERTVVIADD